MNALSHPTELVIRPIAGEGDLFAMAAVAQRSNQADLLDKVPTVVMREMERMTRGG